MISRSFLEATRASRRQVSKSGSVRWASRTRRCRSVSLRTERLLTARRDEGDGCQLVEEAVTGRALSTRSCTGRPTSARCPRERPTSYTTRRRAEGNLSERKIGYMEEEPLHE